MTGNLLCYVLRQQRVYETGQPGPWRPEVLGKMKSGSLERKKKKVLSEKGKKWFLTYRLLVQWRWPSPARLYNCHPRAGASEPELPTPVRSAAFCLECSRVHPHYAKVCSERQNCVLSENEEPVNTLPCLKGQISISS